MGITLEERNLLRDWHELPQLLHVPLLDCLRSRGVRRDNVGKNIGVRKYAFNSLQRKLFLPQEYIPPTGTGGGSTT